MKAHLLSVSLLAVSAVSLSAVSASAAAIGTVSCKSGSVTATGFGGATACAGSFSGNDTGAGNPLLTSLNGGLFSSFTGNTTWKLLGKSDAANSGFTASNGATKGSWSLLQAITGPFVISLKSSTGYSAYFFDGKTPITSGTFNTLGVSVNKQGKAQALSHASIFVTRVNRIPEPATTAALGMVAIGGLGMLKKKSTRV
jgi:hypothetical protein